MELERDCRNVLYERAKTMPFQLAPLQWTAGSLSWSTRHQTFEQRNTTQAGAFIPWDFLHVQKVTTNLSRAAG